MIALTGRGCRIPLALLLLWTTLPTLSAKPLDAEQTAVIDAFVSGFTELAMFDGVVLIDIGGEIVYEQTFGRAQVEFDVPHTRDSRFRIASVSKAVTDAAVARLVQQGRLSRDVALAEFLPEFPSADTITIGQLLDHRSGIPHTNRLPWGDGSQSLTIGEIVARLTELPLDFDPGTQTSYSNGGYAVLARVVEIAGGGDFAAVVRRLVLDPLGMSDSGHITDARQPIAGLATGYEPGLVPGERRHARFYAVETRPGGGSMYSTAPDLLRFLRGIFRASFVPAALQRDVMGLTDGGFLSQGRSPGFVAKLLYQPERDLIVVSLANSYAVPAGWAATLADLASGEAYDNPWPSLERALPTVPADDPRIGRYRSSFGDFELELARSPAGYLLSVDDVNAAYAALIPLADGAYLQPQYFQRCEQDAETRIITCRMLSGDDRYTSTLTPVPVNATGDREE